MIETRDLTHRRGETTAVDGISVTIDDGESVVLAGPNGAGKTTLVQHFNGLLEPDEGSVEVNGRPVSEDLVAARTTVGMVFQDPRNQFVAATVAGDVAFGPENLGLDRGEIDRRVDDALAAVNMAGREDDRVDQLSGGERERVAIAGALAMRPDHLVLDEPFTGLDDPARRSVMGRLRSLRDEGTSLIVVTHDLRDVLDLVDRLLVVSDGRHVVDGSPERVLDAVSEYGVRRPEC
ncbi:MAG: ABC transporter ATP-binding protein [Halobacteriales archaeon]